MTPTATQGAHRDPGVIAAVDHRVATSVGKAGVTTAYHLKKNFRTGAGGPVWRGDQGQFGGTVGHRRKRCLDVTLVVEGEPGGQRLS